MRLSSTVKNDNSAARKNYILGSESDAQISDERQMIRCDECLACTWELDSRHLDPSFVIDVVEMKDRKHARVGPPTLQMRKEVDAVQLLAQHPRREASRPLVEVADDDFWPCDSPVVDERGQTRRLEPALEEGRAEMDVVDVDDVGIHRDVDALDAARLARPPREVVLRMLPDRQPAENDVAKQMSAQVARGRHDPAHAERRAQLLGVTRPRRPGADDFLQGDDVRIDVLEDAGDAVRPRPTVEAAAAVDVVGGNAKRGHLTLWVVPPSVAGRPIAL
jgi:hypothetical protein